MPQYRKKPYDIEAFQLHYTPNNRGNNAIDWPTIPVWLRDALHQPANQLGSVCMHANGLFVIKTEDGVDEINPGDYVVRDPDGFLSSFQPGPFEAQFTPVVDGRVYLHTHIHEEDEPGIAQLSCGFAYIGCAPLCNRPVYGHEAPGGFSLIEIFASDPSHGGAAPYYSVQWPKEGDFSDSPAEAFDCVGLAFQDGPMAENGVNGLTNEIVLAIVADRLSAFQNGPYRCRENAIALTKIEEVLHWLHHRTQQRQIRGVDGTSKV